jgi:hypothetical protein
MSTDDVSMVHRNAGDGMEGRARFGSLLLRIPESVQEVMVECEDASVVENDGPVLPGDGLPPPLVVDTPAFANGFYAPGGFSRQPHVDGLSVLIGVHGHGTGLTERLEARPPGDPLIHGSKLRSACRRSGIRDHGSTSTTR